MRSIRGWATGGQRVQGHGKVAKTASRVFSESSEVVSAALAIVEPHRIKAAHRRRRRVASGQSVQRYYDPAIGRFLSVDPVGPLSDPIQHFGRYQYAYNNPYRYTDPDGRCPMCWGAVIGAGVEIFVQTAVQGKSFSEIDVSDVVVAAGAGALTGGIASVGALAAAKGTVSVASAVARTGAGSAATGVTASLAKDALNGKTPDVGDALVEGAVAGVLGAAGQRLALAPTAALETMAAKGGLAATVAETTRAANVGSNAAKVAAATSQAGSNAGEALNASAEVAKARLEERK